MLRQSGAISRDLAGAAHTRATHYNTLSYLACGSSAEAAAQAQAHSEQVAF